MIISMDIEKHLTKYYFSSCYDFAKLKCLSGAQGMRWLAEFQKKTKREIWNGEVYYSQILEEVQGMHCGSHPEFMVLGDRQNLGHMPLLGSVGRVFWDTLAKDKLGNPNQK